MSNPHQLFTELYRPADISGLLLPQRIKELLNEGEIVQNLLLYGAPGTGKTSTAFALTGYKKEYSKYPTLYINVSEENGIDVIRDKITDFCSSIDLINDKESIKVVILDEFDGASANFYAAFRAVCEKFARNCRFIATCNYINKIPDPIRSRFSMINMSPVNEDERKQLFKQYVINTAKIFKEQGIAIEKDACIQFVKKNFPDYRTILNKIQEFQIRGITEISLEQISDLNYSYKELYDLILGETNAYENFKVISLKYSAKIDECFDSLGKEFIKYLNENRPEMLNKLPDIIIKQVEYQSKRHTVIDPLINLLACVYSLQLIVNKK